jgi:hypothetical protein
MKMNAIRNFALKHDNVISARINVQTLFSFAVSFFSLGQG